MEKNKHPILKQKFNLKVPRKDRECVLKGFIFRMESSREHRKNKKLKRLAQYRRMLGIQGNSGKDPHYIDPHYILKRAMERISILEADNNKKEEQITILVQEKDFGLHRQILEQQRELLALRSSAGTREKLIRRQEQQIEENKWIIKKLEQDILDLKSQIWPSPWVEGTSFLD